MSEYVEPALDKTFPCGQCGAHLKFKPGTDAIVCEYCGHNNPIQVDESLKAAAVEEIDFEAFLANMESEAEIQEVSLVKCRACGAESSMQPNITSDHCAFCGTPLVLDDSKQTKQIKPKSLLPFKVTDKEGIEKFRGWLKGLWFAPSKLKRIGSFSRLDGMYIPYWTYDSNTYTTYSGERGDDYQETEYYTDSNGNRQSRTVTKTRWWPVSGSVYNNFDDVLVVASDSLPKQKADALEPWDLENLTAYNDQFLSGFRTESYHVDVKNGFEEAKGKMDPIIRSTICSDIGGDHQRIHAMNVTYNDITFKHTLLPIWISSYRYSEKVYRFLVNGRTGEVQGERPYSWVKITAAIVVGIAAIGIGYAVGNGEIVGILAGVGVAGLTTWLIGK